MRIDYSNRRQVSVNRPKKNPFRPFLLLTLAGAGILFGLGVATGWLLFGHGKKSLSPALQNGNTAASASAQTSKSETAAKPQAGNVTPHLTFYDSLPKGDKELIGTGLNPKRDSVPSAPSRAAQLPSSADIQQKPSNPQKPASSQPAADNSTHTAPPPDKIAPADNKGAAAGKAVQASQKPTGNAITYTVQLASYHDKKEAEDFKAKWAKKGYSVRIVESSVNGKGTLYRVRIGNRMSQETANQLSAKIGSGAIAVPDQGKNDAKQEKR
ncbi:MAG: SPOR domain-containing protein [Geobacteraceae bacterium]|nr:SPOR domain-containing protein [Geobacteraceae bacterium]